MTTLMQKTLFMVTFALVSCVQFNSALTQQSFMISEYVSPTQHIRTTLENRNKNPPQPEVFTNVTITSQENKSYISESLTDISVTAHENSSPKSEVLTDVKDIFRGNNVNSRTSEVQSDVIFTTKENSNLTSVVLTALKTTTHENNRPTSEVLADVAVTRSTSLDQTDVTVTTHENSGPTSVVQTDVTVATHENSIPSSLVQTNVTYPTHENRSPTNVVFIDVTDPTHENKSHKSELLTDVTVTFQENNGPKSAFLIDSTIISNEDNATLSTTQTDVKDASHKNNKIISFDNNSSTLNTITYVTDEPMSTANNTEIDVDFVLKIHQYLQYVTDWFILPALCPISIVGNILVAFTLIQRKQSNTANRYLISLLVTDILSLVSDLFLPIANTLAQSSSWSDKEKAAQLYFWNACVFSYCCRRLNLNLFTVLSFERFVAITKPFEIKTSKTVTQFHWFVGGSILLAGIATAPTVFLVQSNPIHDYAQNYTYFLVQTNDVSHNISISTKLMMAALFRILESPIQIIFFTVMNILAVYSLHQRTKSTTLKQASTRLCKPQAKLLKVSMLLLVTNVLAYLPQTIAIAYAATVSDIDRAFLYLNIIVADSHILRALNSMTDYVVLIAMSKEIRTNVKNLLQCRSSCKTRKDVSSAIELS